MPDNMVLEKTNRINMLVDFYEPLLTEKQRTFLKLYVHDDYSLGEIAEEYKISRQAVYEHIKRAEQMLEEYESKLALLDKHEQRLKVIENLNTLLSECDLEVREKLNPLFATLAHID
jgi:predicted DNA-binding protein YlxM (UPF0122 family)